MTPIEALLRKLRLNALHWSEQTDAAAVIEAALPALREVGPVARVAEVHMSRYTLEWLNGPLPEGALLYGAAPPAPAQPAPAAPDEPGAVEALREIADYPELDALEMKRIARAALAAQTDGRTE